MKATKADKEMAECLVWAINNLKMPKGSGLIQRGTTITHWNNWFKYALEKKGFKIEDKK